MRRIMQSHWSCLLPLLPYVAMYGFHAMLRMSDVMGMAQGGARRPTFAELAYNYAMVVAFYLGIVGYVVLAAARGTKWLFLKIAALAAGWYVWLLWIGGLA